MEDVCCRCCARWFSRRVIISHERACRRPNEDVPQDATRPAKALKRQREPVISIAQSTTSFFEVFDSSHNGGDYDYLDGGTSDITAEQAASAAISPAPVPYAAAAALSELIVADSVCQRARPTPLSLQDFATKQYSNLSIARLQIDGEFTDSQMRRIIETLKDPCIRPSDIQCQKSVARSLDTAMAALTDQDHEEPSPFDEAVRCILPRPADAPAWVPQEVEFYAFSVESQLRAILALAPWDRLRHSEDMARPEPPTFPGGPAVLYGCPSLSGQARRDFHRDMRLNPPPEGVVVLPLAIGGMWDGGRLSRKKTVMGYPFRMLPFFLKLPYRWQLGAIKLLALLPSHFPKGSDSAAEHDALHQLFQDALWLGVLKEIVDIHHRGGFYVDGIAGAPLGVRVLCRLYFLGVGGDKPAVATLLETFRCCYCIAPMGSPYAAPGFGPQRRTEAIADKARKDAASAASAAAAKRALKAAGVHSTRSSLSRLCDAGCPWEDTDVSEHVVPDVRLHSTQLGEIEWYSTGVSTVFKSESDDGSAAAAVGRLIASNASFSTGKKHWVSLRNYRAGISKWDGYMRTSELVMTLAALRAVALDLGDGGSLQADLISLGEGILIKLGILEAEQGDAATLAKLQAFQASTAAQAAALFEPFGVGFDSHMNNHTNSHLPEIMPLLGAAIHWDSAVNIEAGMKGLLRDYTHSTGVWGVQHTLAGRHDKRAFVDQVLGPVLDRVAATATANVETLTGHPIMRALDREPEGSTSDSDPDDHDTDKEPDADASAAPVPYTRFPDAPPIMARCTGELWPGMHCVDRLGQYRVGARFLQVLAAGHAALRAKPEFADLPPFCIDACYFRRALRLSRPPSLQCEGCKRLLAVVPSSARNISSASDARRYSNRQPCVQLLKPRPFGGGVCVPDIESMRRVEALVSIDVRPAASVASYGSKYGSRMSVDAVNSIATLDFALVTILPPLRAAYSSSCFKALSNAAPSIRLESDIDGSVELSHADLECFELLSVNDICQPRWAFPSFGDEVLPPGDGEVGPWDGPLVSVLIVPGS